MSMLCFIGFKFAIILKTFPVSEIKASQNWPVKLLLSVGMPFMGARVCELWETLLYQTPFEIHLYTVKNVVCYAHQANSTP